ncbi:MAG: hypothetical protein OEV93_00620 [Candidatus Moranbacteria bacterium]|nr:hypothetical protein [Candidatus Moranbacteria bacterium]
MFFKIVLSILAITFLLACLLFLWVLRKDLCDRIYSGLCNLFGSRIDNIDSNIEYSPQRLLCASADKSPEYVNLVELHEEYVILSKKRFLLSLGGIKSLHKKVEDEVIKL